MDEAVIRVHARTLRLAYCRSEASVVSERVLTELDYLEALVLVSLRFVFCVVTLKPVQFNAHKYIRHYYINCIEYNDQANNATWSTVMGGQKERRKHITYSRN